jgi:hypothetical protein
VPLSIRLQMSKELDPAHVTCVLEVLTYLGLAPDDSWAEVQSTTLASGQAAVALSLRLVFDDGLLVRHVSALAADETLGAAIERVAAAMHNRGLRSVDIVAGEVDVYEQFYTRERVNELLAQSGQVVAPILH